MFLLRRIPTLDATRQRRWRGDHVYHVMIDIHSRLLLMHSLSHHNVLPLLKMIAQNLAQLSLSSTMPLVHVTWLPKAVRADPKVRQAVAGAIIKALTASDIAAKADIPTDKLVVRFSEAVDGFQLPEGHTYESLGLKDEK